MLDRPLYPDFRIKNLRARRRLDELASRLSAITEAYERLHGRRPSQVIRPADRDSTAWGFEDRARTG